MTKLRVHELAKELGMENKRPDGDSGEKECGRQKLP